MMATWVVASTEITTAKAMAFSPPVPPRRCPPTPRRSSVGLELVVGPDPLEGGEHGDEEHAEECHADDRAEPGCAQVARSPR